MITNFLKHPAYFWSKSSNLRFWHITTYDADEEQKMKIFTQRTGS